MKLKTKLTSMFGTKIVVPVNGEIEINENGEIEVEDQVGHLLLQGEDWISLDAKNDSSDEEEEDLDANEEDNEEDENDAENAKNDASKLNSKKDGEVEMSEFQTELGKMELQELVDLAKNSKLKGYNLFAKDASKMRIFLKKKLEQANTNE